jgi:CHAT domain-containing protein
LQRGSGHTRPRLYWCPTGAFSSLPLHAAGIYDGPDVVGCADFVVSSYTPTLSALLRAQNGIKPGLDRDHLSLTLVGEKRASDLSLPLIPGVEEELKFVNDVSISSNVKVINQPASGSSVTHATEAIKVGNIIHLACHGIQDVNNSTQSGFSLGDGRLTISMLMELKVVDTAFLAYLSACDTTKGEASQSMHLAAAMLFCGFKSVVATMW